jgi:tetratricopeptide (TPR) repeat protein
MASASNKSSPTPIDRCRRAFLEAYDGNELFAAVEVYFYPVLSIGLEASADGLDKEILTDTLEVFRTIITAKSIGEDDIQELRALCEQLRQRNLSDIATLLALFIEGLILLVEEERPFSHCYFETASFTCDSCGREGTYLFWKIINTTVRDDLKRAARAKEILRPPFCHYCGGEILKGTSLFYCDPERGEYLIFAPWDDNDEFRETLDGFGRYLMELPPEFKGGTTYWAFYEGFPGPWCGPHDECMMLFRVDDPEDFHRILNDQILYDSKSFSPFIEGEKHFWCEEGYAAFERGDFEEASRLFAKWFLRDQIQYDRLLELAAAQKELGRKELAEKIEGRAMDLYAKLRAASILTDIRFNYGAQTADPPILLEIWKNGLPTEWGFDDLIAEVRLIAER